MEANTFLNLPLADLVKQKPAFTDFLNSFNIKTENINKPFPELLDTFSVQFWDDNATTRHELLGLFIDFAKGLTIAEQHEMITSVEILAGIDKSSRPETCNLHLKRGEVTCIVGPTGSGKSRLLADIEWLANCDTPTKRRILINGEKPNEQLTNAFGGKLVAQITQNMNFVLDMDVQSFLTLHAESRLMENPEQIVSKVINLANELSGEAFTPQTPVTFLSGGQSRALMIADVACIGQAPIVLIDEIENAGVDKRKALELLVSQDKIVLMATHDPLLILLADKRVVIKNGGMNRIITTNKVEKELYTQLEELDNTMQMARNFFRHGNVLNFGDNRHKEEDLISLFRLSKD
ncbi:ABC transporter ATP-binding protein [Draconibacterium sediminis]|uniref:ATP-binding cassette domain-containing protein n=1 Tax=Draconibacterium sediminis TaxID=1544798 RepID=UPI0026F35966|nr:ATP-binding cassette domain-containing protein [Draconibacterium sediminis]